MPHSLTSPTSLGRAADVDAIAFIASAQRHPCTLGDLTARVIGAVAAQPPQQYVLAAAGRGRTLSQHSATGATAARQADQAASAVVFFASLAVTY